MLSAIVRFAIRFRGVIIALACLLTAYGLFTLTRIKLDVFPEFAPPLVMIQTEAPGLSPKQVEVLVTQPLENSLNGLVGLKTMYSKSAQGLSMITLTFRNGTDIYRDRQMVSERLGAAAANLPRSVKAPALLPLTSSTAVVLGLGLTSATHSLMDLRTLADWTLKPQLLAVPGVSGVTVFGGQMRQLQVQVKPSQMLKYGLSLNDVLRAARRATGVRGGGFIDTPNQRIVLSLQGQPTTPAALAQVVLRRSNGVSLLLGDVAHVDYAPAPMIGAAAVGGREGVVLMVEEAYGADTMAVTRALDQRLQSLKPALAAQGITLHPDLFRPADFISTAIGHLRTALLLGALLVVTVLFLFLFNARAALISATAIPLSLLSAVVVLRYFGVGLNTMTLGGLAIALGEVVDDAIVDVENIFRRLRENRALPQPRPAALVALRASVEVRGAVVYATFIVALVFLPVLTLSGVAGKLFAPLGLAYIAAILASLAVALTVTPALAYALLGHVALPTADPAWIHRLKGGYARLLGRIEQRAGAAIAAVLLLCALALGALFFFGANFLPALKEGHYIIHMKALPGTSLSESLRLGRHVTLAVSEIPGVRSVAQRVGRATQVSDPAGTFSSEFEVNLSPGAAQNRIRHEIQRRLTGFAGARFKVNTFLTERIEETISGYTAPVVVDIHGNNLDLLDRKAQEVAAVLQGIPGAAAVQVQAPAGSPQLVIRLREHALARLGIDPVSALDAVQTAYQGALATQTYHGNRVIDVTVMLDQATRSDPARVGALPLRNADGMLVPLREVADIYQSSGRFLVLHKGGMRTQTVTAQVHGRPLSAFVAEAQRRIRSSVSFPQGSYFVFTGDVQAQARAQRDLLMRSALAAVGIVLLLFIALGSMRSLLLVFLNLPFALAGGVVAVLFTGGVLSTGSLVGFVTLFGITLRNAIMMISHYQHLVHEEGMRWGPEAALRGASERLVPILMTALVTALGLLPLALTSGSSGNEIEGPMAIVILGGLATSTLLNLLILPTLALRFGHFDRKAPKDVL